MTLSYTKRSNGGSIAVLVACLLCSAALVAPAAAAQLSIEDVSFDDEGVVETRGDVVYLWQSDAHTLDVTLSTPGSDGTGRYEFCVESRPAGNDTAKTLECRSEEVSGNATETVAFEFEHWPADLAGRQSVRVVVRPDTLDDQVVASATVDVHVLAKSADDDGDGLTNRFEVAEGTNFSDADTDDDGLRDDYEVHTYETDPVAPDTDGDGLEDGPEVNEWGTDPNAPDTDGDGLDDYAETNAHGTDPHKVDTDGDGIEDAIEIHTYATDPTDADTDDDGLDDHVETNAHGTNPNAEDTDDDGLNDALEVNTYETNPNAVDTDGDGLEDGPEIHAHATDPTDADTDGDRLEDGAEENVHDTNPNDPDTDGDRLADGAEIERFETNPNDPDTDGDGRDDHTEARGGLPFVPPPRRDLLLVALGAALVGGLGLAARRSRTSIDLPSLGRRPLRGAAGDDEASDDPEDGRDRDGRPTLDASRPLSNEDTVRALLSEHGGRMRQSAIVEETGWSKSKVSRVLSKMESEDEVSKIDVGRGNIITIPGREPERSKSPFEGA